MSDKPEGYDAVIDSIHEDYTPRAMNVLIDIQTFLKRVLGWDSTDIYSISDEEYDWRFATGPDDDPMCHESGIDVSLTLGEAIVFGDGGVEGDAPFGVSFRLDFIGHGGRIVGLFAPYNYTDQCWVDGQDRDAVEERFRLIEGVSLHDLPPLIEDYLNHLEPA